jgi:DNA-binding LacI/PurR family transcriptional regulator
VTSHDVASLAGVSRSAVSRTFTPDASVSEKTRRKVLAAAQKLGYQPNVIARSLITRQSRLIGLIMGEWENPFYTTMLRGFTERLGERDYRVMLLARPTAGDVEAAMRMLMQYRVDGMVLVSASPPAAAAADYARGGGRLVLVNREADGVPATSIVSDAARDGREIGRRLIAGGYARIALARGDATLPSGVLRTEALREAIAASGRARIVIDRSGTLGYAAGRAFGNEVMALPEPPDAIVCSTDMTAIGVLDAVRIDRALQVPRQVGVVGFGDIPASGWASHDLTTIRLPLERMIDAAVATVIDEGRPATGPRRIVVEGEVVVRSTLRDAPSRG